MRGHLREQAEAANDTASVVTSAYDQMTGAATKHFEALVLGHETAGAALQGFVHDTLESFAKIASQQAIMNLAAGIAAVFTNPPAAAGFFASAALYGVAAGLAGLGAAATAPSTASASGGARGGGERAASVSPHNGAGGNNGTTIYQVNYAGSTFIGAGGVRQASREMMGTMNRGATLGGVQLLPGVLQHAGAGG